VNYYIVYVLESDLKSEHYYVGFTEDLESRLIDHNQGKTASTSKYRPWRIKTFISFRDCHKAKAFEKYLKSGSGRAFLKKRL